MHSKPFLWPFLLDQTKQVCVCLCANGLCGWTTIYLLMKTNRFKPTEFKFDLHAPKDSPDMIPYKISKKAAWPESCDPIKFTWWIHALSVQCAPSISVVYSSICLIWLLFALMLAIEICFILLLYICLLLQTCCFLAECCCCGGMSKEDERCRVESRTWFHARRTSKCRGWRSCCRTKEVQY